MHSRYQEIKGLKISEAINLLSGVLEKLEILTQDVCLYLFYAVNLLQEIIILIFWGESFLWTGLHGINIPLPYAFFSVGKVKR